MNGFNPSCMFCVVLAMALIFAACTTVPPSETAEPSEFELEATLEVPSTLPSGEAVRLGFTLTNNSATDLYVLKWYTLGSGIHQARIGMYAPAYDKNRTYEAETGYLGDLGLLKDDAGTVEVRVLQADDASLTLHYLDTLGRLAIEKHNGQVALVLHVAEDLPDDVSQKVFTVNE